MSFARWLLPVGLAGAAMIYAATVVYNFYRQDLPGILHKQQDEIMRQIQKLPQ